MARKPPADGGVDMHPNGPEKQSTTTKPKARKSTAKKPAVSKKQEEQVVGNTITGETREKLRNYVRRIESLEADKKEITEDISEVYGEVKSSGFDVKALRKVIAERRIDKKEREDQLSMFELYWDVCESV